jgi:hypothetical protein
LAHQAHDFAAIFQERAGMVEESGGFAPCGF